MTDDRMALKAALEKGPDTELLNHMLGFVAERLVAPDVDQLCNASRHDFYPSCISCTGRTAAAPSG